jgi:hypothetical protein
MAKKKTDLSTNILANASARGSPGDDMYIALSIRPGDKISAMLDILSKLTSKSGAEFASDGVPESLFLYLASSEERLELAARQISEILLRGDELQEGSALELLVRRSVIEIAD